MSRVISAPARVAATGMFVPQRVLANADFEKLVDTNDEWIVQRTGIKTRHVVSESEHSSDLAFGAIDDLLEHHPDIEIETVDYILVASTTPDYVYPSLAAMIQDRYGIPTTAGALDISGACAGFVYAINLATGLIATRQATRVLAIAADALTRSADYTDRSTCVLFGDGAGVALIEHSGVPAILGMTAGADGSAGKFLYRTNLRFDINGTTDETRLLRQDGRNVFRWVMENIPLTIASILDRAGLTLDEIDWFVPHSANLRMIEALARRIEFPMEKTLLSIVDYGNTSAVSIPLALIPAVRDGRIKAGDRILLTAFGGGLVSAGNVIVWQ
ncbi:MAG: beta-ketoacyl-ACP synthase 3 [Vulcanimicrobiaceae bacterium]